MNNRIAILLLCSGLLACKHQQQSTSESSINRSAGQPGLKDVYKNYFPVGVAVSPRSLLAPEREVVTREFNSLTPENAMKPGPIHPAPNTYYWKDADAIVAFAVTNNMKVRGHTLCWYMQNPGWWFVNKEGKNVSRDTLLKRLRDHIHTVVGRYKGKVYAWDVVNEAISDGKEYLRPGKWLEIVGEDYIAKAFEYAHEADPDALLFYNDYNEINTAKSEKIIKLVSSLKAAGVPIHGVGLQSHWAINEPARTQLDSTLARFSRLGLQLQITELDISVYPKEHQSRERNERDRDAQFTPERATKQAEQYKMCFELFRKYSNNITGVTFWNVSDRHSWLDDFPVKGRKDYPLLFDTTFKRKQAYNEITSW